VVFIGFMGAGKTTAAWNAATALHAEPLDVDALLEQRLGKPIARVFAEDGEPAFRAAEERATLELLSDPATRTVALGGGASARCSPSTRSCGSMSTSTPPGSGCAARSGRWHATG
jgi:shikimate kinase